MTALMVDALLLTAYRLHSLAARLGSDGTWMLPFESSPIWANAGDGSPIEFWGQVQLVAASGLLWRVSHQLPGRRVLAVWGVVLMVTAVDDRLRIHERVGRLLDLNSIVPFLSGWAGQEVGGLVFWTLAGTAFSMWLLRAYSTSSPAARRAALTLLIVVLPVGVIAVAYVALSAIGNDFLVGLSGVVVVDLRVAAKLLTTTACLILAMRWTEHSP
ncbi:hypothetical protein [Kocuria flava]|nr:hypothetical protein [Kocuria flava]